LLRDVLVNEMEKLKESFKYTGCQAVSSIKEALDKVQCRAAVNGLHITKLLSYMRGYKLFLKYD